MAAAGLSRYWVRSMVFQGSRLRSDHFQNRAIVAQAHDKPNTSPKLLTPVLGAGAASDQSQLDSIVPRLISSRVSCRHGVDTGAVVIVQGIAHGGAAQMVLPEPKEEAVLRSPVENSVHWLPVSPRTRAEK